MALPLLVITCFISFPTSLPYGSSVSTSNKIDLKHLAVWHIGNNNTILNEILAKMQQSDVQIKHFDCIPKSTKDLNESALIIFDGNWISKRVNKPEIHKFSNEVLHEGAKLIAIGGSTSKFFEMLNNAGINKLGLDKAGNPRNPAYFDPPIVGFKFKGAITPEGYEYLYPSIFVSNTTDTDVIVQALVNWLGG